MKNGWIDLWGKRNYVAVAASLLLLGGLQGCFSSDPAAISLDGRGSENASGEQLDSGSVDSSAAGYRIGYINNGSFVESKLGIGLDTLAAGASAGLEVVVIDKTNSPISEKFVVSFSSECISKNLAEVTTPVDAINGRATTTYQAKGCTGEDLITARAEVGAEGATPVTLQAQGTIEVQAAALGAIEFVSSTPTTIALQGMGGAGLSHVSTVRFRVVNAVGGPVANQEVNFALNTTVGGIKLQPASARTDSEGYVQTVVEAGTVHTSVRVTAETSGTDGNSIRSQSSQLVVSTGVPDQNSVSLSLQVHNPEAWSYDGEAVAVTVFASDRFNNPVPDGTSVSFYTELGQIGPSCQTAGGVCTVNWISSNPRTRGNETSDQIGRSTITAVLIGEDSFVDLNGDGRYSSSDRLETDNGEVFHDWYEAAIGAAPVFDTAEPFLDFNGNGLRDVDGDGLFTGLGCDGGCALDSSNQPVAFKHVSDSAVLVMSESNLSVSHDVAGGVLALNTATNASSSFNVTVQGLIHGQVPPAGTVITVESDIGKLYGETSYTVPSTNSRIPLTLPYVLDVSEETESKGGRIQIKAQTPKGVVSGTSIGVSVTVP